ncbi:Lariat debranching enzyme, C-terminal domain containing protein [Novymonas esmeraldas]|uniref:Lariat debranching enzyme, C-terminal domain containing protein n=1 Tax=Novymonas esmeraldas TaxID=1808958 RepID=A0AAW0EXA9_9TRYP
MSLAHKIFATLKTGGDSSFAPSGTSREDTSVPASPSGSWNERFYHVAVQGCCHGELDRIYDVCSQHERQTGKRIDVLLCCGDFQAVRTAGDMDSMAVPDKYKVLGDFHKYYADVFGTSSVRQTHTSAPYLTIFIGGNHENSDLLAQESYGGFVAPGVYYLGHSGVVTVDDCLTIAGLSGIFKEPDYDRPYPPRPYAANHMCKKGAYHVRHIEVEKLHAYLRAVEQLRGGGGGGGDNDNDASAPIGAAVTGSPPPPLDMFLSHDWPVGITSYGDEAQLLRFKPYFKDDIRRNALGNPHTLPLLREAKAPYWFAAHLHCYFEATVAHASRGATVTAAAPTKFVALDKCAKGHGFLTFIDIPRVSRRGCGAMAAPSVAGESDNATTSVLGASRIRRDPVWLEVLKASHPHVSSNRVARARGGGGGGGGAGSCFDVQDAVRTIVARCRSDAVRPSAAALLAPTTAALLAELELSPAFPLQMEAPATASAQPPRRPAEERESPSTMWRSDGVWRSQGPATSPGASLPSHQPRVRTEPARAVAATTTAAPLSCAPPPSSAANTHAQPGGLTFVEDLEPARGAPAAPPLPRAAPDTTPAPPARTTESVTVAAAAVSTPAPIASSSALSWFEDTAQP